MQTALQLVETTTQRVKMRPRWEEEQEDECNTYAI